MVTCQSVSRHNENKLFVVDKTIDNNLLQTISPFMRDPSFFGLCLKMDNFVEKCRG